MLEGSFRLSRLASNAPDATTRALEAHTEELRLTRLAREKEDDPIERTLKAALDPTRRFGGETLRTAETLSVADSPALQIICDTGAEYENTKAVSLYRSQRTFAIALQNSSRNMFVSNCKLYLDIINPKTGSPARHLILDSFTLNPTESWLVEIVHYAEPTGSTRGDTEKDRIVLHLPHPTRMGVARHVALVVAVGGLRDHLDCALARIRTVRGRLQDMGGRKLQAAFRKGLDMLPRTLVSAPTNS